MTFRLRSSVLSALPFLLFACGNDLPPTSDASGGTGNATGGSTATGGAGGEGALGTLIDDFEDGDEANEIGTSWYPYTDSGANGASIVKGAEGGASIVGSNGHASSHAIAVEYTLAKGDYAWDPFVGVGFDVPESTKFADFEGISYWYKGAAHTLRFETTNVADYDYYVMQQPFAADWTKVTIPFSTLAQAGYGAKVDLRLDLLTNLNFHIVAADGSTGSFALDDVWLETSAPVDRGPKNLPLLPPNPPAKTVLPSIAIPTALQTKAMAELDRGYNITNWLESGRFESFLYDEAFVEKLAAVGFKSVRLPIDLDLYVNGKTGSGDAVTLTIDDDLWTILDSFDTWTKTHGLSLTIDYHQYDKSWNFSDVEGTDEAVALWKAVAAHFKASPREDIYFELLNEPELSVGASGILPATDWTPVAQRMIDAIRVEDTKHTIIFGDVNWYGIDQLAARTPFSDTNIVYAFHSYEPFIFTHQGADWAQMGTTHDVPFPYSMERWSEYGSDFGLTNLQANWIWDQYKNYNVQGTVEAMYNRVAKAKQWAVTHQVPVICNEFGVYDKGSKLEDRVAYYTALIDIYEELEIPWQHWFMIMDAEGKVIPEYVTAFHLDE